jgi:hypothetical protein
MGEDFLGGGGDLRGVDEGAVSLPADGWSNCLFVVEKGATRDVRNEATGLFSCLVMILILAM